jgi:hypothetical protein
LIRSAIVRFVVLSAVLVPALLLTGVRAGSGGTALQAEGTRTVTFYVA